MLAEESFPVCKLRSAYARQCQSTIAWQRAKTEVDERFVASCVRARFPQITYNSQPGHTALAGSEHTERTIWSRVQCLRVYSYSLHLCCLLIVLYSANEFPLRPALADSLRSSVTGDSV